MKKIILSVAAICMMAVTTVSAQDFTWGAKVGLNMANLSTSYDYGDADKSRTSFVIGVTGAYSLSEKSFVSAELLYSAQGDKFKYDEDYGDGPVACVDKINLGYLNIPILFNYYVIDKLAVKAGIQPGFLLGAKNAWECDGEKDDEDIKSDYNSIDFSIPVGVSYDITESIVVDARYNIGLSNISAYDGSTAKNNVFQLSVGYKF